ncbi:MAG TPA: hypothetical protein VII22_17175 [Streptosporangiaceae bacterium]
MRMTRIVPRRPIGMLAAASIIAATAVTATAGPASADPRPPRPCYASSCNGMNPYGNAAVCGSSDWYNNVWVSPPSGIGPGSEQVRLYYSPYCNSNWAVYGGFNVDEVYVHNTRGNYGWDIVGGPWGYTQMVDGSVAAQGVIHVAGYGWLSTRWY